MSRPFWISFSKKKICLIPWKVVKGSWVARIGQNFDDYPSFQPMRSWAKTYAQDCIFHCLIIEIAQVKTQIYNDFVADASRRRI